jgi:hypothetical protein
LRPSAPLKRARISYHLFLLTFPLALPHSLFIPSFVPSFLPSPQYYHELRRSASLKRARAKKVAQRQVLDDLLCAIDVAKDVSDEQRSMQDVALAEVGSITCSRLFLFFCLCFVLKGRGACRGGFNHFHALHSFTSPHLTLLYLTLPHLTSPYFTLLYLTLSASFCCVRRFAFAADFATN